MIFEDLHWADPTSRELLDPTVQLLAAVTAAEPAIALRRAL